MITSILYIFLAVMGLSVLIFIHELGHYLMARHVGMRVETFAIGFGSAIYSWERDGVKWQIGWLPFGGFVRIAGQDLSDKKDPYEIPDGFFGKRPIDQIKVAFAGPCANLIAAMVIFTILWAIGGREKHYAEYTHKIGWVDPESELYAEGVRPGDEIAGYNHQKFQTGKDHVYAPMTSSGDRIEVSGYKVDYATGNKELYSYNVKTYPRPNSPDKAILTSGIIQPSNYLIYDKLPDGAENPLPKGSPLENSGIKYGDRVVWVNGQLLFSTEQLSAVLNDGRVFITVERNGVLQSYRVPTVAVEEFKLDPALKEELADWQYEAGLNKLKLSKLLMIPYNLSSSAVVESPIKFIDKEEEVDAFPPHPYAKNDSPLLPGDKIVAVEGVKVSTSFDLLKQLQQTNTLIIVERGVKAATNIPSDQADAHFDLEYNMASIDKIVNSIGSEKPLTTDGKYALLGPITLKTMLDFDIDPEAKATRNAHLQALKKEAEAIEDPDKKAHVLHHLQTQENQLLLGIPIQDQNVSYNPNPLQQFSNVYLEVVRTIKALFTGVLNPKWISGPIGIIQVVHDSAMSSFKEGLFWLGAISLNLGMLNLLPIPILDGGSIVLSLAEIVTRRRIHPSILEKVVLPFAVILVGFFLFLTYQDLSRIFTKLLGW